jgi:hypothetical protein
MSVSCHTGDESQKELRAPSNAQPRKYEPEMSAIQYIQAEFEETISQWVESILHLSTREH